MTEQNDIDLSAPIFRDLHEAFWDGSGDAFSSELARLIRAIKADALAARDAERCEWVEDDEGGVTHECLDGNGGYWSADSYWRQFKCCPDCGRRIEIKEEPR